MEKAREFLRRAWKESEQEYLKKRARRALHRSYTGHGAEGREARREFAGVSMRSAADSLALGNEEDAEYFRSKAFEADPDSAMRALRDLIDEAAATGNSELAERIRAWLPGPGAGN